MTVRWTPTWNLQTMSRTRTQQPAQIKLAISSAFEHTLIYRIVPYRIAASPLLLCALASNTDAIRPLNVFKICSGPYKILLAFQATYPHLQPKSVVFTPACIFPDDFPSRVSPVVPASSCTISFDQWRPYSWVDFLESSLSLDRLLFWSVPWPWAVCRQVLPVDARCEMLTSSRNSSDVTVTSLYNLLRFL